MSNKEQAGELLREQYRDAGNLNARIRLHQQFSTNPYGWNRWLMDHYLAFPEDAHILEVGCGPASTWSGQLERVPPKWQIVLSDFSAGMVAKAREATHDTSQFICSIEDAQAISFPTHSFDAVIANHMLYHVPDRRKTLAEIRRVLKPGGVFLAATNGTQHMRELDELMWKALPNLDISAAENSMQNLCSAFSLENGAEQISTCFESVQCELYPDGLAVNQVRPLVEYMLSMMFVLPEAQRIRPEAVLPQIERTVAEELRAQGTIHITKNAGIFIAR